MQNFNESSGFHSDSRSFSRLKLYSWKCVSQSGEVVSGKQLAYTELEVRAALTMRNLKIIRIKCGRPSTYTQIKNRISEKDILHITTQLTTMLAASVPVVQALQLISGNSTKASIRSLITSIIGSVESGSSLSQAIRSAGEHFPRGYSDLVEAGETSGKLAEVFERITRYQHKTLTLKNNLKKAMLYPCIVLIVTTAVLTLMLVVVIPEFEALFYSVDAKLPLLTHKLILLSEWFQHHITLIASFILVTALGLYYLYRRSLKFRYRLSKLALRLPVTGALIAKSSIAKFSRTLSTCYDSGVPILTAIDVATKTVGNLHYQKLFREILNAAAAGTALNVAMRDAGVFPQIMVQMVMAGEESGTLDQMLNRLAEMYESEVDNSIDNLGQTIEPLLIVILGIIIGTIVVSMYLPIFNLLTVLG